MRNGGEKRGSSYDRRRRKHWLLKTFGDGIRCKCVHCGKKLTFKTLEQDRIEPGGSYRKDNLQPSCRKCNIQRSNNPTWAWGKRK